MRGRKGRLEAKIEEKTVGEEVSVQKQATNVIEPLEEENVLDEEELKKVEEQGVSGDFLDNVRDLRKRIQLLEREKLHLLEEKNYFLNKALVFNCPHCEGHVVVYREGDRYWAEKHLS